MLVLGKNIRGQINGTGEMISVIIKKVEVLSGIDDTREIDLFDSNCQNTEQIEIQVIKENLILAS